MSASRERRRLAGQEVGIDASFVLALFGTLRLSRKAVVGFTLPPPGRRRSRAVPPHSSPVKDLLCSGACLRGEDLRRDPGLRLIFLRDPFPE